MQVEGLSSINVSDFAIDEAFWQTERSGVAIAILSSTLPDDQMLPCVHAISEETLSNQALRVVGYSQSKGFEITNIRSESLNVKSNEECGTESKMTDKMICVHKPQVNCFVSRGSE